MWFMWFFRTSENLIYKQVFRFFSSACKMSGGKVFVHLLSFCSLLFRTVARVKIFILKDFITKSLKRIVMTKI